MVSCYLSSTDSHDLAPPILQLEQLSFGFPQGRAAPDSPPLRPLFSELNFFIPPGVTLIRGDDGGGKTTLIRLLAGDLSPQAGDLLINGVRRSENPEGYRQQLFWANPSSDDLDQISALQYFDQQRVIYPNFPEKGSPELLDLVDGLGLSTHIGKPMYMLSTGSKRKVWLAAAFAAGAAVTLLDEPFAALDRPSILFVLAKLAGVANQAKAEMSATQLGPAIVVSHYEAIDTVPLSLLIDLSAPGEA